jgi:lipooligosaccharide transport system permease protein
MKTWKVNFIPPLLEPIFYLLALGFGLGTFVRPIEGLPYIQFIAPALVSMSMMYSSFFECTYGSFVRMYYQKTFDAIIATPISIEEVIAGEMLWGATRSLISSSIVLAVAVAFGLITNPLITSPLALLIPLLSFVVGIMFSAMAMCFTSMASTIDFLNYPGFLFITPMFLLSGTFFSLSDLPWVAQILAQVFLPLTHVVNLSRRLAIGRLDISMIVSLLWIVVAALVFFFVSISLMKRKLIK